MPSRRPKGKVHDLLGPACYPHNVEVTFGVCRAEEHMGIFALMIFVGMYGFGGQVIGMSTADSRVQLIMFTSFLCGIVCGYSASK
jgi:hypothetical protein